MNLLYHNYITTIIMSVTEPRVRELINEQLYNSTASGSFTNFTLQEKVAYALKLSLNRITTDAFEAGKEWFREPEIYNPVLKSSILKNTPLPYTLVLNYYVVVNINGKKYISNVTLSTLVTAFFNYSISQILTNAILPETPDNPNVAYNESRTPIQADFSTLTGRLISLPRNAWASFVYWKKQLTGTHAKRSATSTIQSTVTSGTYPYINNLSSVITLDTTSNASSSMRYSQIIQSTKYVYDQLKEYTPLQLISNTIVNKYITDNGPLNQIGTGAPQELLDKIYTPVAVNLSVPTYSTWNGNPIETLTVKTDNMAFYNPILERSLSETFGYQSQGNGNGYGISAPLSSFTNVNTSYGQDGSVTESSMIFNGDTGFVQFFGLAKPLSSTSAVSVIRPPIVTALKYVGETLTDGVISQVDGLPDPTIYNLKDLRIDTTTNTIYRLGLNNNDEKEWISIGGTGSGSTVNRIITGNEVNFYNTLSGISQTKTMNARGIGLNNLDISANKFIFTNKEMLFNSLHIIGHGITRPVTYDISLIVINNTIETPYSLGTIILSPTANTSLVPDYDILPTTTGLIHRFPCQGTYINEYGNVQLIGGTFSSINPIVGYSSLMISTGSSATISPIDYTNEWTISFWYKLINAYHDGSGTYILYFKDPTNPTLEVGCSLIYLNNQLRIGDSVFTIGDIFNTWVHISLRKSTNVEIFVNGTLIGTHTGQFTWGTYTTEFANYESVISESTAYICDISIYDNLVNPYQGISQKSAISRINAEISEITIPAKSILYMTVHKLTPTFLPEVLDIKLISKKYENLDLGHKIRFEKAIQFEDPETLMMHTGINMETYYNDELGNQGEIEFPNNTLYYNDLTTSIREIYVTHYDTAGANVEFDLSLIEINGTERNTLYETTFVAEPLKYDRPMRMYNNPVNAIRYYTCDNTYHNIRRSMDISAQIEGAVLIGGMFKQINAPVHNSSLYVPSGTGVTLSEFDWEGKTLAFWYRQEHCSEKSRNMIVHFNTLVNDGNPTGIYLMYDASNSRLYVGGKSENGYVPEQTMQINMVDNWTHITIQNNKVIIRQDTTSEFNLDGILWGTFVAEFCNWSASLLKTSAFLSDICIFNESVTQDIAITEYPHSMSIKILLLSDLITIRKSTYVEAQIRPRNARRGYIRIECVPDIPYNSSFSDTDGIMKYTRVQTSVKDLEGQMTLYHNPVESKQRLIQPYFYTYKLKHINSFSIIKNNSDDVTYDITIRYGSLVLNNGEYEIKTANEYKLTNAQNISSSLNYGLNSTFNYAVHSEPVDASLCVWFPCDGYMDNYAGEVGYEDVKLLGGVFTTSDYKIGNSALMLSRGSGASLTSMNWSGNWTISVWFKYVSTTFIDEIPILWFGSKSHTKDVDDGVHVLYDPSNNKVYLSKYNEVYNSIDASLNEWSLITLSKNNDEYALYVGEVSITQTIEHVTWDHQGNILKFAMFEGGNISTACYIDDIRVYNRVLSDEEIGKLNTVIITTSNAKCMLYTLKTNIIIPDDNLVYIDVRRSEPNRSDIREQIYLNFYANDVTNDIIIDVLNSGIFLAQAGNEKAPTFSFLEDRDTGMYSPALNQLGLTVGGHTMLKITMDDVYFKEKSVNSLFVERDKKETIILTNTNVFDPLKEISHLKQMEYKNYIVNLPDGAVYGFTKQIYLEGLEQIISLEEIRDNIYVILKNEQSIYIGGEFGVLLYNIDTTSLTDLDFGGECHTLLFVNGILHAGGLSETLGNVGVFDTTFTKLGNGLNGTCYVLKYIGNVIYAGGDHIVSTDTTSYSVAKLVEGQWVGHIEGRTCHDIVQNGANIYYLIDGKVYFNNNVIGETNDVVYTIEIVDGVVYVGGRFTEMNSIDANNIAMYLNGEWSSLGTGLNGICRKIKHMNDQLYIGGEFTVAGNVNSTYFTIWDNGFISASVNKKIYAMDQMYIGGRGNTTPLGFIDNLVEYFSVKLSGNFSENSVIISERKIRNRLKVRWSGRHWNIIEDPYFVESDNVIYSHKRVGLGVTNPQYRLELPNNQINSIGKGLATAWATHSDGRIKSQREEMPYGLNHILDLNPLKYVQYNSDFDENGLRILGEGGESIGLIAQEVVDIIPHAVHVPANVNRELYAIDYNRLVPVLIKAIKEMNQKIDNLKEELDQLKNV